jgi:hypothetical protein
MTAQDSKPRQLGPGSVRFGRIGTGLVHQGCSPQHFQGPRCFTWNIRALNPSIKADELRRRGDDPIPAVSLKKVQCIPVGATRRMAHQARQPDSGRAMSVSLNRSCPARDSGQSEGRYPRPTSLLRRRGHQVHNPGQNVGSPEVSLPPPPVGLRQRDIQNSRPVPSVDSRPVPSVDSRPVPSEERSFSRDTGTTRVPIGRGPLLPEYLVTETILKSHVLGGDQPEGQ